MEGRIAVTSLNNSPIEVVWYETSTGVGTPIRRIGYELIVKGP